MNEIVLLNHNDSDAIGCLTSIYEALPDIKITMFETNYQNIYEVADEMKRYIEQHQIKVLFVTDVSFSDTKPLLLELSTYCPKFLWIDHHHYPDGFFDDLTFKYVYDHKKSASLLTYEYFKLNERQDERAVKLGKLIRLINAYDIWLKDTPEFQHGFNLNNYSMQYGVEQFATMLYNSGYKLPDNYLSWVQNYNTRFQEHYQKLQNKQLVFRANHISVVFSDEFIPEIVFEEHKHSMAVMVANSYGLLRFRLNQDNFPDELKHKIKDQITPVGHLNAFTIKINKGFDNIMKEIQVYTTLISKEFNDYGIE